MGRHCKIKEVQKDLLKYIGIGVPNKYACQAVGIDEHTLYNWIKLGEKAKRKNNQYFQFLQSYTQAKGMFVVSNIAILEKWGKEKDYRAIKWLLEVTDNETFGNKQNITADVTVKQIDLVKKWANDLDGEEQPEASKDR